MIKGGQRRQVLAKAFLTVLQEEATSLLLEEGPASLFVHVSTAEMVREL